MEDQACKNCRFWSEHGSPNDVFLLSKKALDENVGICFRYPPIMIPSVNETNKGVEDCLISILPRTRPNHWCGEWQPKQDVTSSLGDVLNN